MAEDNITLSVQYGRHTASTDIASTIDQMVSHVREAWGLSVEGAKVALQDYLKHVAQILTDRNGTAWPSGTTETSLSRRTGQSMASIIRSVKVSGSTWETLSGNIGGRKELAIHEFGGTIRAQGKLLTIPLPAALGPTGTSPPFARQWKNTFVATSRRGNLIIFQRRGVNIVPLYVLKSSVKIKPRLGMRAEIETQAPYFIAKAADLVVAEFTQQLEH